MKARIRVYLLREVGKAASGFSGPGNDGLTMALFLWRGLLFANLRAEVGDVTSIYKYES